MSGCCIGVQDVPMHVGEMRSGARQIASIGMTGDDRAVATEALLAAPPKTNAGTGPTKTAFLLIRNAFQVQFRFSDAQ